jgi:hypothetical protein
MDIFDSYSAAELREIFRDPTESWPENFCNFVNQQLADDLLDQWLEQSSDNEYRDRVKDIIEDLTYGYEDKDGNEMLEFDPLKENDGQLRLFE